MRAALALTAVALSLSVPARAADAPPLRWDPGQRTTSAFADEPHGSSNPSRNDGVYGRFDGLFDLGLGAGAELDGGGAAGALRASLHYFSMAGVYAGYADALGSAHLGSSRALSFGVDLRPTFVPRWSSDLEGGSSFLDLTVDSISLGLGAYFREPAGGRFADRRGLELSLGFGVPLMGRADGPWLAARGNLRWDDPAGSGRAPAQGTALATLGWHWMIGR